MRWVMGIAFTAALFGLAAAEDKPAEAAKKLEGSYTMVECLIQGKPSPKADEVKSVEIKDGVISIKNEKRNEDANFTLDPSQTPRAIDLKAGKSSKTSLGIYQTKETEKGLELTIAFVHDGGDGDGKRPKDFKGEGKDEVVIKLLRNKK